MQMFRVCESPRPVAIGDFGSACEVPRLTLACHCCGDAASLTKGFDEKATTDTRAAMVCYDISKSNLTSMHMAA